MYQKWFDKAKLGIFIHWGIYAVNGIAESWSFGVGDISYDDYMKQLEGFTASKYDPKKWAKLFKKSGAKYVVLTSKHHDGVALFDTKYTDLNVVKKTPAGRDLIAPYCDALRDEDLKVGIYFTNTDWSDLDHYSVVMDKTPEELREIQKEKTNHVKIWGEVLHPDKNKCEPVLTPEHEQAWERFMQRYKGEITELLTNYGNVDLLWFDVMLARNGYSWDCKNVKEIIESLNPNTLVNSRLGEYGDYETPELYIPLTPLNGPWELCTTFNNSWGYRTDDKNYKDVRQIVRMLCECISKGGNMLISVGPDAAGEIEQECQDLMLELGTWTDKYAEAVYPTIQGIGAEYFSGGTTLTEDKKTLYLFVYDRPYKHLMLNGIRTKIKKINSMVNGAELTHTITGGASWVNMPGCIWIDINEKDLDDVCTVIKVEFEDAIDLVEINKKVNSAGGV